MQLHKSGLHKPHVRNKVRVEHVRTIDQKTFLQFRQTRKFPYTTNSDTLATMWLVKCYACHGLFEQDPFLHMNLEAN